MLKEFRAFIARGNVLDLAVAVIIGAAFGKIVSSLTDDIIMPVIGRISGGLDFSSHFIRLGAIPADYKGSLTSYADLKKAGVPLIGYGQFVTQVVDFLIVAFIIFLIVRGVAKAMAALEREKAAAPAPGDPAEIVLLREIRDALKASTPSAPPTPAAKSLPLEGE
ncbi:large conductance mechanosensitive channel protein MscL [Sphingomonas sp.]|uniref:large conductance mechanosensitive channel protein MscL n=1 Tax=Sphingomonas sp. TaxID=28214 RepID=UPI003B3A30AF